MKTCETVRVGSTMRRLTYVTYVALIGCRSIQLSEEAFFFLVRLKRPIITAQWSSIRLILTRIMSMTTSGYQCPYFRFSIGQGNMEKKIIAIIVFSRYRYCDIGNF